jgi:hypothetical protein
MKYTLLLALETEADRRTDGYSETLIPNKTTRGDLKDDRDSVFVFYCSHADRLHSTAVILTVCILLQSCWPFAFHCSHPEHSPQNHPQPHPAALSTPPTQHTPHTQGQCHMSEEPTDQSLSYIAVRTGTFHMPGTPCSKALLCGNLSHLRCVTGRFVTNVSRDYSSSIFRVVQSEMREPFPLWHGVTSRKVSIFSSNAENMKYRTVLCS